MRSDIQMIIGLLGAFFACHFFLKMVDAGSLQSVERRLDRVRDDLKALQPGQPRDDAANEFNEAILLYQRQTGRKDASDAIRDLAADSLRLKGFLR